MPVSDCPSPAFRATRGAIAALMAGVCAALSPAVGAQAAAEPDIHRSSYFGIDYGLVLRIRGQSYRRVEFVLEPNPAFRAPTLPAGSEQLGKVLFNSVCRASQPFPLWGGYRVRLIETGEACVGADQLGELARSQGAGYCLEVYQPAQPIGGSTLSLPVQLVASERFTWGDPRSRGLMDIRIAFDSTPWPADKPVTIPCLSNTKGGRPDGVTAFFWPPTAVEN